MRRGRGGAGTLNPWPGYVDALSTLLMVLVFVLLVFVLAQAFLSVALNGRDQALDRLGRKVAELADMLALERGRTADLTASAAQLNHELAVTRQAQDAASSQAASLGAALGAANAARDAALAEAAAARTRLSDANTELAGAGRRVAALQSQLADAATHADQLAAQSLARLADQVRDLTAQRDQSDARASQAEAARQAVSGQFADALRASAAADARIALLNQQIETMRAQLAQLAAALDVSQKAGAVKDVRIADLGAKLNAALISKVAELQRYRSEFFGRLRQVLAGRPGIAVVGDRFVFQSEVLFPAGSSDLTPAGREQITQLATTLKSIAHDIPADIPWVLRVDGHADRQAKRGRFADNWSLSAERAITVVRLLAANGVPSNRLAAAGFGEFQPLDAGVNAAAYARNRRIELRLTDR